MNLPIISRKQHEKSVAQIKEQYGVSFSALEDQNKAFQAEWGKALNEYKSDFVNYIASQVNYAQFQYQDYTLARLVTELYLKDAVVATCISKYQMLYPEPFKVFYNGEKEASANSPLGHLIQNPNPWMSESDFDRYLITYQLWTGNAYGLKIYADNGEVEQIFPFSGLNIYPVPHFDKFVGHYNFVTAEGIISHIDPEKVIHFPWISIDPRRTFMGVSPMQLSARDIQVSILLTELVGNYLKNMPLPSYVMTMTGKDAENTYDATLMGGGDVQTAEGIKQALKERYSGGNIGNPGVLQTGWDMKLIGLPLKDLNIEQTIKTHQCNICSNFSTDPEFLKVVAGLTSSTYDNQQTSKLNFYQSTLTSLWVQNGDKLTNGLKREFGEDIKIEYDLSTVGVLKEFRQKDMGRIAEGVAQWVENYFTDPTPERRSSSIASVCMLFALEQREVEPMFPEVKKPIPPVSQVPLEISNSVVNSEGKAFLQEMWEGVHA